ncbi:FliI/YscN family ATPase [Dissulfurirhabdus thermomarina]|uniref:FliI/YscN family ATPase n=1 Tax=Dissulfurirhabdus thermomarina TaxID=1765737 RepID=A0A6N9TQL2_DISTH|nr:FliI/YscN family ATPase [Dissulfurirhabdus thermomarina]NDY43348.1 FliI/YscN family ATPase [Dissulfurirhabdus thermomarina]NMX23904.1 FliI/YscN family ATPase [Dissulfurirhabdus thermomarina]
MPDRRPHIAAPAGLDLAPYVEAVRRAKTIQSCGVVNQVIGMVVEGRGPGVPVGGLCRIELRSGERLPAEVVGFRENRVLLMPLGEMRGVEPGAKIWVSDTRAEAEVGEALLGRIIGGLGAPLDDKGPVAADRRYPLYAAPLNPMDRPRIDEPVDVGVAAINACLTLGKGQRVAIMAGSGVGKSTLLGMIARHTSADVSVIGLIGERGRELRDFIERDLGPEGLARSVVVVATSDQPPLVRLRGAYLATAVAEYFRDQGKDVILMMDSVTRFAMAYREVGLAIGEPPTSRGYTPSVFGQLPRLLERAGRRRGAGSITGIYTVLVEGDDMNEPIADAIRAIVDGHIVLSRELAHRGHYPAIDVLASISRIMRDIAAPGQIPAYHQLIRVLSNYRRAEDLINIGAYVKGSNREVDFALQKIDAVQAFLRQEVDRRVSYEESVAALISLFQ